MNNKAEIILGPPGCGKTKNLLDRLERLLEQGVHPSRIAYVSFTKKATREARDRAKLRFGFVDDDMPWFRTVHSLSFKQIAISPNRLIKKKHLIEIGNQLGFEFKTDGVNEDMGDLLTGGDGDQMLFLDNLARITGRSLEETFQEQAEHKNFLFSPNDLFHFANYYKRYKMFTGMIDYTDAIEIFVERAYPPDIDYLIVDEAQDLSYMQWLVIDKLAEVAKEVYIAGDDDQAIFRWAGADVDKFLSLAGRETHLEQSYRVPARVHRIALSILQMISRRRQKTFAPKRNEAGEIVQGNVRFTSFDDEVFASKGSWYFLARHGYQLKNLIALCEEQGWFYSTGDKWSNDTKVSHAIIAWESLRKGKTYKVADIITALEMARAPGVDGLKSFKPEEYVGREALPKIDFGVARPWFEALIGMDSRKMDYFRRAMSNGERMITKDTSFLEPRIRISTIHGVKGGEAAGVFLLTDISKSTSDAILSRGLDDEARVFYVGATRAKEQLVIKNPITDLNFELQETL